MEPSPEGRTSLNETVCPECESPIDSSFSECPECGALLRLVCHGCGADIDPGMKECPSCGAKLVCPECGERMDSGRCENCFKEEEPDPAEQEFDIGVELMDELEYEAAELSFTEYLDRCEKGEERSAALVNRAYCRFHLRKWAGAEDDFTEALHNDNSSQLRFYRAQARRELGKCDEAIEDFSAVLDDDPQMLAALLHRGETRQQADRHSEALADFDTLIAADPSDHRAHFRKSESLLALKKPRDALAELVLARDLGSERADETLRMLAGKI